MKSSPVTLLIASFLLAGPILFAQEPAGVHNFHKVNENVYRGAQPTKEGFQTLANLGVKTIVDLRGGGGRSQAEQRVVEANGMRYIPIPLSGYAAPSNEQVSRILALLNDASAGPVFVHCRRGADRTGTVIACYRISHDHWRNGQALAEAAADGMSHLEMAMKRYVLNYTMAPAIPAPVPATVAVQ